MRRRLGVVTKALGAGAGLTLALSACGLNSSQPTPDGYMTAELATTITVSVAENGLVSRGLKGGRQTPDLRATSVLHQAGIPNLPAAHPEGLESVCETYADSIPPQQLADEVSHIFPDDEFGRAIAKLNCASLSPPSREPGMPSDPQHYVVLAATWTRLPGVEPEDLSEDQVRAALQELSPEQGKTPWIHWNCKIISEAINAQNLCNSLPSLNPVTKASSTEELMDLRAQIELGLETSDELVKTTMEIAVQDALDAEQILRISRLKGRESTQLQSWLEQEVNSMNSHGLVAVDSHSLGTLEQTYIAARLLEDRTKEIFNDKTETSMDEVVNLATTTSQFDGLSARLMRAVILRSANKLDDAERSDVLKHYAEITASGCPSGSVRSCLMTADAALQLDDHASPLRIAVPQNLPDGAVGDTLVYRVLGMKWGVANVDEWVATAKARGIDPLSDVADAERPTSLRIWAASARGAMHPDLSTQQEEDTKERLQGLTTCDNVERLAMADQDSPEKCSLDSTFAYYLSSVWGIK